jgi:uncharacterized protein YecE (DUF72 family)
MRVWVGTSGFSYDAWWGTFYPNDLRREAMLAFYARHFAAVEINNTFYRSPRTETLEDWAEETPNGFRFSFKCPRLITHQMQLAGVAQPLGRLAAALAALGPRLGPVLFQLPPSLRHDSSRLREFLNLLRESAPWLRAAFEFRHRSWFSDDVYDDLHAADAALCVAESEDLQTPVEATTSWGYLRLRRESYGTAQIAAWAARIGHQPWTEAYAFVKHETPDSPHVAMDLQAALTSETGLHAP